MINNALLKVLEFVYFYLEYESTLTKYGVLIKLYPILLHMFFVGPKRY